MLMFFLFLLDELYKHLADWLGTPDYLHVLINYIVDAWVYVLAWLNKYSIYIPIPATIAMGGEARIAWRGRRATGVRRKRHGSFIPSPRAGIGHTGSRRIYLSATVSALP
jgi:hypothetical protein